MRENIFLKDKKEMTLEDYMNYNPNDRGNLGDSMPVMVYRLFEYSLREQLKEDFGKQEQIRILRGAGYRAGTYFARNMLDMTLPANEFIAQMLKMIETLKIGVLRVEKLDLDNGQAVITVAEDVECSGLPVLGEAVCNYDEGFISGILSAYTGKRLFAVEVDCWATGDRVCRFHVDSTAWETR